NSLAKSMERLSSGLKINHASDNPSGIAIASRMQAQIDGLNQANNNSNDGTSVIQTADGALGEVTDMLQRMRELSVQAANGTMSDSDREAIQKEIESLKEEINRISNTTQFNTKNLLDGSMDARIYGEHCSRIQSNENVPAGTYIFIVDTKAESAVVDNSDDEYNNVAGPASTEITYSVEQVVNRGEVRYKTETTTKTNFKKVPKADGIGVVERINQTEYETVVTKVKRDQDDNDNNVGEEGPFTVPGTGFPVNGTMDINGITVDFYKGMSGYEAYERMRDAAERANVVISDMDEKLTFTSKTNGSNANIKLEFSAPEIAMALGFGQTTEIVKAGMDPKIDLNRDPSKSLFGTQATSSYDGKKVTVTDVQGFELSFMLQSEFDSNTDTAATDKGQITLNVTDIGIMKLQIGSNMGQTMSIRIKDISCESMYIDDLDVTKAYGPENALTQLDSAIAYISGVRSQLGAYENRL
ncbi:MAG: hypothetical protein HUJ98_13745, partial [Bacteroidaceae bacterium]|nr:hypothetical protein [Bacteroidaceae bacterium]